MNYQSWSVDFPCRVAELIRTDGEVPDREITRALAFLFPAVLMSFERITCLHALPTLRENSTVFNATKIFESWLAAPLSSEIQNGRFRFYPSIPRSDLENEDRSWLDIGDNNDEADPRVCCVQKLLRHAFAHGNLWTSRGNDGHIKSIGFANEPRKGAVDWQALVVNQTGLKELAEKWSCIIISVRTALNSDPNTSLAIDRLILAETD